jgi:dolichyl-phosphate-mannose-protein mannosyltransferase
VRRWPPELWLLLALAAFVRFYGLRFGILHPYARPDELPIIGIGKDFLTGDLNPHFSAYPTLYMYVLAALDYAFYLYGRAMGWYQSLDHFLSLWPKYWTPYFVIARTVSAIAGTLTVAIAHRIAIRLFDRLTAGIATLFLALAFLPARDSHFGVTDTSMVFWLTLAFLFIVRAAIENRRSLFAIAGIVAGLGASTKYNVLLMFAPVIVALLVAGDFDGTPRSTPAPGINARMAEGVRRLVLFGAFFGAAFVAGSPYSVLDFQPFFKGVRVQAATIMTPFARELGPGGIYHLKFSLRHGIGLPLLVTGVAGLAWTIWSNWRKGLLLAAFPLAYYALLIPTHTVMVRYAIPLIPFLCIGAAWLIADMARRAETLVKAPRTVVAVVVALLVIAPSAYSVARIDRLFAATDSRMLAADWIRANVKPGSTMHLCGNIVVQPVVDYGFGPPREYWSHRGGWNFATGRPARPVDGLPEWIVVPDTANAWGSCAGEVRDLAAARYDVQHVIKAMDTDGNLFDQQDAFFYPFAGFRNARRGGPNYVIYLRRDTGSTAPER